MPRSNSSIFAFSYKQLLSDLPSNLLIFWKFSGCKVAEQLLSICTNYSKCRLHSYTFSGSVPVSIFLRCWDLEIERNFQGNVWNGLKLWYYRRSLACNITDIHGVKDHYISGPHFVTFGLNTDIYSVNLYSVRMQENADEKYSRYRHFLLSDNPQLILYYCFSQDDRAPKFIS